jgi:hypothetical protein
VDNHCAIGETFALAIPVSVLWLISGGIREFPKKHQRLCRCDGALSKICGIFHYEIKNCEDLTVHFGPKFGTFPGDFFQELCFLHWIFHLLTSLICCRVNSDQIGTWQKSIVW